MVKVEIRCIYLRLVTDRPIEEDASKMRGFIGNLFKQHTELHQHIGGSGYIYSYPKVQYKVINGEGMIIGINEACDTLREISNRLSVLALGKNVYEVKQVNITEKKLRYGCSEKMRHYRFITPWIALNQKNIDLYNQVRKEKDFRRLKDFINSLITANVLSMSKSLNFVVTKKIEAHSKLDEVMHDYKQIPMVCFTGDFRTNFHIPEYFGLGKGVSQGNGVVMDVSNNRQFRSET